MSITVDIFSNLDLKFIGTVDAENFYRAIRKFFNDRRYKWHEEMNKDKGFKKDREIEWHFSPLKEVDDYCMFTYKMFVKFFQVVEYEKDGKLVTDSRVVVKISCDVVLDYKNRYTGKISNWIHEFLVSFFLNYYKSIYHIPLEIETIDLHHYLKGVLGMEAN